MIYVQEVTVLRFGCSVSAGQQGAGEDRQLCFSMVRTNRAKCECALYSLRSSIFSLFIYFCGRIEDLSDFSLPAAIWCFQNQSDKSRSNSMKSGTCIYIIAGMKKFFVFLFLLRIWHFGDGALFLFFNLIFYFPHHRLLPTPFTHSLVFASVPLSHIHHLNKFHPNLISWNIVCDRQNNEWAKQMNGCRDWHFLHHFDENPSRQNTRFGVFFL